MVPSIYINIVKWGGRNRPRKFKKNSQSDFGFAGRGRHNVIEPYNHRPGKDN